MGNHPRGEGGLWFYLGFPNLEVGKWFLLGGVKKHKIPSHFLKLPPSFEPLRVKTTSHIGGVRVEPSNNSNFLKNSQPSGEKLGLFPNFYRFWIMIASLTQYIYWSYHRDIYFLKSHPQCIVITLILIIVYFLIFFFSTFLIVPFFLHIPKLLSLIHFRNILP